uniref:Uncharacterized protein n=2 Tax=Opuntia streptacantha TaxID=393608 RepID=A0A7C9CFL3_OPUST
MERENNCCFHLFNLKQDAGAEQQMIHWQTHNFQCLPAPLSTFPLLGTYAKLPIFITAAGVLLGQTFLTSCNGARSPLAREPDDLYLNDDIAETNLSRVFPDISE